MAFNGLCSLRVFFGDHFGISNFVNFMPAMGYVIVVVWVGWIGVGMGGCCGCVGGKRVLASWRASFISLGVCLYTCLNASGVRMVVLVLFCICGWLGFFMVVL